MTHLATINTVGRMKSFDLLRKHEYEFSFKITLRDSKSIRGDSPTWRQDLANSIHVDEMPYAIECLAEAIWVVGKFLEAKITELWDEPQPVLLLLDFAYGAIVDARIVYGDEYLEQQSLDILERFSAGSFARPTEELDILRPNWN